MKVEIEVTQEEYDKGIALYRAANYGRVIPQPFDAWALRIIGVMGAAIEKEGK